MSEPVLYLHSENLLSKWGFNDGDIPDEVWDYFDDRHSAKVVMRGDWHVALTELVKRHLLPVLDQDVEVSELTTTHNPIRVDTVNGEEVDHYRHDYPDDFLTPAFVTVPMTEVERALREAASSKR